MSARHWSMAMILALTALPAAAETAKARGGSSGGHSGGSSHHSSSPGHSAPPHAVSRGSGSSSASGPESRHPRAGTGRGYGYGYGHGHGGGYYPYYPGYGYYGYGYGGFPYFGFSYGYGYGWPYYYGAPYAGGYYGHYAGDYGSVRVLVDPNETRVFVDGSYAGTADDFDGLFQRLHAAPGRHELTFKLEGYQTHRVRVYVPYDGTLKVHYDMVRGAGEDTFEDMAGDRPDDDRRAELRDRDDRYGDDASRDGGYDAPRNGGGDRPPARDERTGTLRFDVMPDGASIYVDGVFRGTGRTLRRLDVPQGTHRVEILHPGLRTFERDVNVDDGESQDVQVELTR